MSRSFDGGEFSDLVQTLVLREITEELGRNARWQMDLMVHRVIAANPLSWEERLALAIEQRSIRNRLRRTSWRVRAARREWASRLNNAVRALRGDTPPGCSCCL